MARIQNKDKKNALPFILTILSLILLGSLLVIGFMSKKPDRNKDLQNDQDVLGEAVVAVAPSPTTIPDVDVLVRNTIENTQNTISEKVIEVKEKIISSLEKEVTKITEKQVESLKLQVCTDWGVITPASEKKD